MFHFLRKLASEVSGRWSPAMGPLINCAGRATVLGAEGEQAVGIVPVARVIQAKRFCAEVD